MKSRDSGQGSPLTRCWPPLTRCSAPGAEAWLLRTLKSSVSIYSHNQVANTCNDVFARVNRARGGGR